MKPTIIEIEEDIEMVDEISLPSRLAKYKLNISAPNEIHPTTVRLTYVDEDDNEVEGMEVDVNEFMTMLEKYYEDNF